MLLGPSGCGKTTLLRMIGGLEPPTAGEILIGGNVVTNLPPRARQIAMVFQSYALYPHMSVYNNIAFPLKAQRMPKEEQAERVAWAAAHPRHRSSAGSQAAPAFRWPAPAGGAGQGAGSRAQRFST